MKKILKSMTLAAVLLGLVSCNPETFKKINYLQDIHGDTTMGMKVNRGIIIQPQDQLSIIVTSRDPPSRSTCRSPTSTRAANWPLRAVPASVSPATW